MLDAIVQLTRNFLCCIKDLGLLQDTWLYDASIPLRYYDLPAPVNKTTPLEAFISVVQFYVFYSGVPSSWTLMTMSYGKVQRIYRLVQQRQKQSTTTTTNSIDRLIHASLYKEGVMAIRSLFVGFNVFCITFCFFWLTANSWHVTETDWIGGLPALIHALTVMNVCLTPLLYYMYRDANEQFAMVARMGLLREKLSQGKVTEEDVGLSSLEAFSGWLPFWDSGCSPFAAETPDEDKLMKAEAAKLISIVSDITGSTAVSKKGDGDEKAAKLRTLQVQQAKAAELEPLIAARRVEGYREYVYLVLNAIAWYGYGACILVYYWPEALKQPYWLKVILLHFEPELADWHGNFAGDLMWTIEPVIILGSPLYLSYIRSQKPVKSKKD